MNPFYRNCAKQKPCNYQQQCGGAQPNCPCNKTAQKTPMEECQEIRKYNQKCGRKPPDDCYDISLVVPDQSVSGPLKFFCPAGDTNSQLFHLCDNEVISLANTCGEITLSRQCLDDDETDNFKMKKNQAKEMKKVDKKRGKERYKQCKKNAKQILKKYKAREKERARNEKEFVKKCLKFEQKKMKVAKQKYKVKKAKAKEKMKNNKKKNKARLKKLAQRLKQRCVDMKTRDPNDPRSDSDSEDSMFGEDPMNPSDAPACDDELTCCFSLTTMDDNPVYGCRQPPAQVCAKNARNQMMANSVTAKMPCKPCTGR